MRLVSPLILSCLIALAASHALAAPDPKGASGQLLVVSTIAPLGAIAREVGGDRVRVEVLVPAGGDPHTFVPEPRHRELVFRSDLFLSVGREPFLKMLGEGGRIRLSWDDWVGAGVRVRGGNPHYIWLYPPNAKLVAEAVYRALARLDPDGEPYYRSRLEAFARRVDELSSWASAVVSAYGVEGAKVALAAPHFEPLVEFLGFEVVCVIVRGAEVRAGPGDVEAAIRAIKERGADVVVVLVTAKWGDEGRAARLVSEATGAPVAYLAGVPLHASDDYVTFIKENVVALVSAVSASRERAAAAAPSPSRSELGCYLLLLGLYALTALNLRLASGVRGRGRD